jgi:stress response protein SCP2
VITVDLGRVYPKVESILFLVTSYQGHSLEYIRNAYCRLVDDDGTELARFTLTLGVRETGLVMAKLSRDGSSWKLGAIGTGIALKTPTDSLEALLPFI